MEKAKGVMKELRKLKEEVRAIRRCLEEIMVMWREGGVRAGEEREVGKRTVENKEKKSREDVDGNGEDEEERNEKARG